MAAVCWCDSSWINSSSRPMYSPWTLHPSMIPSVLSAMPHALAGSSKPKRTRGPRQQLSRPEAPYLREAHIVHTRDSEMSAHIEWHVMGPCESGGTIPREVESTNGAKEQYDESGDQESLPLLDEPTAMAREARRVVDFHVQRSENVKESPS